MAAVGHGLALSNSFAAIVHVAVFGLGTSVQSRRAQVLALSFPVLGFGLDLRLLASGLWLEVFGLRS